MRYPICDKCGETLVTPKHKCGKTNGVNAVLGEVLHDIGVWGIENKIPVTKTDKLKEVIVKHFT
jgi:hypothetical protein